MRDSALEEQRRSTEMAERELEEMAHSGIAARLSLRDDDSGEEIAQARASRRLAGADEAAAAGGPPVRFERMSSEQFRPEAREERGVVEEVDAGEAITHEDGGAKRLARRG